MQDEESDARSFVEERKTDIEAVFKSKHNNVDPHGITLISMLNFNKPKQSRNTNIPKPQLESDV